VGAACLASSAPALSSEPPVESVAVSYAAGDTTCPSEERFLAILRRRTSHWTRAESKGSVRAFHVHLGARGDGFAGTLAVTSPDGKTTTREIAAPRCDTQRFRRRRWSS
jgi:hypothetical protein